MPAKSTVLVVGALGVALLAGGTTAATALHKDVTLLVDGQSQPAGGFALTVADVLANNHITLGERDLVYPALTDPVADGQTITVAYSRPVTLNVDGETVSFHTTALVLDEALREYQLHELDAAKLSVSRSAELPRTGLTVEATTPKQVTLEVGGKSSELTTTAETVADLLTERGAVVDADDELKPAAGTPITEGLEVVLDKVEVTRKTKTVKVAFKTTTKPDPSLYRGESKLLTAGENGKAERTYEITRVNGEQTDKKLVTDKTLKKPVDAVKAIGTKVRKVEKANLTGVWKKLAKCESGGNPRAVNPTGKYFGLYQFSISTWKAVGGKGKPSNASAAEQTKRAKILQARAGWGQWPACSRKLGLR
ncbi:MAG: ubiquitin-like domain-containing protein [Propionicimonas sp.]